MTQKMTNINPIEQMCSQPCSRRHDKCPNCGSIGLYTPHDEIYDRKCIECRNKKSEIIMDQQILSAELKELMDKSCPECGCEVDYEVEENVHNTGEFWLAGMCTNHNCEAEIIIEPTGWEMK